MMNGIQDILGMMAVTSGYVEMPVDLAWFIARHGRPALVVVDATGTAWSGLMIVNEVKARGVPSGWWHFERLSSREYVPAFVVPARQASWAEYILRRCGLIVETRNYTGTVSTLPMPPHRSLGQFLRGVPKYPSAWGVTEEDIRQQRRGEQRR